jgi:hypothetical protein
MTDTAVLARALLARAHPALLAIPGDARGPALEALDQFLAAPGPAAFLRATRVLGVERRRALLARSAQSTLRRSMADGLAALRAVPGLPAPLLDRLERLPVDARAGRRLQALASLAQAHEELAGRVASEADDMRRKLREGAPRKGRARR